MNGCTEGKGFYTEITTTNRMSYDPYGQDTEYSSPKVATMDKLRKEANEYHESSSKNIPNQNSSNEVHNEKDKTKWWQIFLIFISPLIAMIIILQM